MFLTNDVKKALNYISENGPCFLEATEKGLKFLRPEKKSQIFEKKIS